jgi:hypothetical protein
MGNPQAIKPGNGNSPVNGMEKWSNWMMTSRNARFAGLKTDKKTQIKGYEYIGFNRG